MRTELSTETLAQLFLEARTHHYWQDRPVPEEVLRQIYELARWGPTSANSSPMRVLYVVSAEAKAKLLPTLAGSNVRQVTEAPVTAVIAYDSEFYEFFPRLFPSADMRSGFVNNPEKVAASTMKNSSLQGGYFMLAARALGLDVGPMGGFNNAQVDELFFAGTTWKSNFLCNLGYGVDEKVYPRGERLTFEEACKII